MAFQQDYDKATKNIKKGGDKAIRAIALQLFGAIIKDTPVDTGRLRGNWQTTISNAASGSFPDSKDKNGQKSQSALKATVEKLKAGQKIFLTNNLPYAKAIEDGHSKQRPFGMVKLNVAKFQAICRKIAKDIKIK